MPDALIRPWAIIPARGGSKGIPHKNIVPFRGKPLLCSTIATALSCPSIGRIIVSTDDPEIADIARRAGADVPILRPHALALDDTPDFPVFAHVIDWYMKHSEAPPDAVIWLRPTSPLRSVEDIEGAFALFMSTGADAVRSVTVSPHHPYWMKHLDQEHRLTPFSPEGNERTHPRRQSLPDVYLLNGAVDIIRTTSAIATGELWGGDVRGYVMPFERSVDIDAREDLQLAEEIASHIL
ncbi:MAG: acylneuraminate cytidylyltransferase family protein [Candidatus Peregrinibacteria bacterium]